MQQTRSSGEGTDGGTSGDRTEETTGTGEQRQRERERQSERERSYCRSGRMLRAGTGLVS